MIGDHFGDKWKQQDYTNLFNQFPNVTRKEFDKLKKEVEEMMALLKRAKIYDEQNNEPNCELEDKMKKIREIAKLVGLDIDEILKPKQ
jgi:Asp-tRNA(Asn)/Glu-tRNA(Gln) amidotransferase C subunit